VKGTASELPASNIPAINIPAIPLASKELEQEYFRTGIFSDRKYFQTGNM
jgi:hypothetical protein